MKLAVWLLLTMCHKDAAVDGVMLELQLDPLTAMLSLKIYTQLALPNGAVSIAARHCHMTMLLMSVCRASAGVQNPAALQPRQRLAHLHCAGHN